MSQDNMPSQKLPPLTYWNFDWDVNLVKMPTLISLFHGQKKEEVLSIDNETWAALRNFMGQPLENLPLIFQKKVPSDWHQYTMDPHRSFHRFRSVQGANFFLEDLKSVTALESHHWKGHSWQAFQMALAKPDTAARTSIISARGHETPDIIEGLLFLQEYLKHKEKLQIHLPPPENIHMVGKVDNPSEEKARILLEQLHRIDRIPILENTPWVLNGQGTSLEQLHLVGFSDDDLTNFHKIKEVMGKTYSAGQLKNTKLTLFYTGEQKMRTEVITPSGQSRPMRPNEEKEYDVFIYDHSTRESQSPN